MASFIFLDIGDEDFLDIGDGDLLVIVLGGLPLTLQGRDLALALQYDRGVALTLPSRQLELTIPER